MASARTSITTGKLARMAIMTAIAVAFSFIPSFPIIPVVSFIRYEFSDLPILISLFAFGTPWGLGIAVISIFINFLIGGAESGPYGMIMHMLAIGAYVLAAGLIYRSNKSRKSAIIGMLVGVIAMTAIMIPANLIITPLFMKVPVAAVEDLLIPGIIPVNLIKGLITAVLTFIVYKRVSGFLHNHK
ncbi:MAG: ECF transporter S component [Oscillospiraceae bacterium]|jgi:riboflavin transporter FmnP|nr:ECF transporter S component [Oscillospiraceae bacterium]